MYEKFLFPLAKHVAIIVVVGFVIVANPELTLAQSPPSGCVWAYNDINYQGSYEQFCGDTNFVGSNWNDAVMSIQIPAGYRAVIYSDADYGGNSEVFWHNSGWSKDLRNADTAPAIECAGTWDRCLSSLKVCADGTCPPTNPASQEANYEATYLAKKSYPNGTITMEPGSTETVWIEFTNSGSLTWPGSITRLGTVNPDNHNDIDYDSPFAHHSWVNGNSLVRPAWLDNPVVPNAVGRFEFIIQAPTTLGSYKFVFRPVVEGEAWMDEYGYWNIEVKTTNSYPDPFQPPHTGYSISGIIVREDNIPTNEPVRGVTINYELLGFGESEVFSGTTTDVEGKFTISGLEPGFYRLYLSKENYNFKDLPTAVPTFTNIDLTKGNVDNVHILAERPEQGWDCDEITEGICVREGDDTYIAVADLDHPNVKVVLAQEFVDGNKMRRGTIFARTNQSAHNNYHVAINASSFKCMDGGKNGMVEEDDKGLNTLVVDNRTIARAYSASFISYEANRLTQTIIYRNGLDFATQYENVDDDHEKNDVRQKVGKLTNGVDFAVGYNATIFDRGNINNKDGMLSEDAYKDIDNDDDYWTAIGVSEDGSRLYLMSTHETMSLKRFASEFQQIEGAHRAILLDSGGSSQFVSMGKTHGTTLYNNVIEPSRGKSDWDTIRHDCNDKKGKPRRIVNAIVVSGGETTKNQQKLVDCEGTHFVLKDYLDNKNFIAQFEDNSFGQCNKRNKQRQDFGTFTLSHQQHPITDTDTLRNIGYFYIFVAKQDDGTLVTPQKPYSMTVFYGEENFDNNLFEEDLALYYKQGDEWIREPTSIVDVNANTVNVQTTSMGLWAILAEVRPATLTLTSTTNQSTNISFSVDGSEPFSLTNNSPYSLTNLYPGDYTITQDPATMPDEYWALVSVTCEDQQGQAVEPLVDHDNFQAEIPVRAGQHVSCTFLNEPADYSSGTPPQAIFLPIIIK